MKITLDFKNGKGDLHVEDFSAEDLPGDGALRERIRNVLLDVVEAWTRPDDPDAPVPSEED